MRAPEDSAEFHDARLLILGTRLSDCQSRLQAVERERDEMIEIVGKPAKAWFDAAHKAEARVDVLEGVLEFLAEGGYGDASVKARAALSRPANTRTRTGAQQ